MVFHLNERKKNNVLLFLLSSCIICHAQTGIVTTGGSVQNETGQIDISIGQVDYANISNSTGYVSAGIQQAFIDVKDQDPTLNAESITRKIQVVVYPNPTHDRCQILLEDFNDSLQYIISTTVGKLCQTGKVTHQSWIPFSNLPNGTYILQLIQNNTELVTFKIIKE